MDDHGGWLALHSRRVVCHDTVSSQWGTKLEHVVEKARLASERRERAVRNEFLKNEAKLRALKDSELKQLKEQLQRLELAANVSAVCVYDFVALHVFGVSGGRRN